jgi:hypothetical protein
MRRAEAAPLGDSAAAGTLALRACSVSGDILDSEERGDAVTTPGNCLALEAHSAEPTAIKDRSPMKDSSGWPVKLEKTVNHGKIIILT